MKKLLIITAILFASQANAGRATLVSCNLDYNADFGGNVYVGTYQSLMSGNYYTFFFKSYCPFNVDV